MFLIGFSFGGQPVIPSIVKIVFNTCVVAVFITFFPGPGSFLLSQVYVTSLKKDSIYSKSAKSSPIYWVVWREYKD